MGIRTELTLRLPNSPGALAIVCRALANERVNIAAVSLNVSGQVHLIVDSVGRATTALRARHMQVDERDVLVVSPSHSVGGLAPLLALIADAGINVDYVYGGGGEGSASAVVVMCVDDPMRAAAATGL